MAKKNLSMCEKLRGISERAYYKHLTNKRTTRYFVSDLLRWLSTDETHLRSLVGTLNTREGLGARFVGRKVCFSFVTINGVRA